MASRTQSVQPDLIDIFQRINQVHFDGFLDPPGLSWNARLRICAGRFFPGSHRQSLNARLPRIEVARYLLEYEHAEDLVADVIGHEMIHYWLWLRKRPHGHTPEFHEKLRSMGVSRFNPVKRRKVAYLYTCSNCQAQIPSKSLHPHLVCAACCNQHSQGKYDPTFLLQVRKIPS